LGGRRLHLGDDNPVDWRRERFGVGGAAQRQIGTFSALHTLLLWHRQLIACKWTYAKKFGPHGS
jgi:hypothetical protein